MAVLCLLEKRLKLALASKKQGSKQGVGVMAKWEKGQSGNPRGRRPRVSIAVEIRTALGANRGARRKAIVERLLGECVKGNLAAIKLTCEYDSGKPKTTEEMAATGNEALTLEQVRAKLAELLSRPEVKRTLTAILDAKQQTELTQ